MIKYMNEIFDMFEIDSPNTIAFLKGNKDSLLVFPGNINIKMFEEISDFITLVNHHHKYLNLKSMKILGENYLFITRDDFKINFLEKYSKFALIKDDWIRIWGFLLEIPNCCVEKYIEDSSKMRTPCLEGRGPAKRYLEQLKKNKIKKDKFNVGLLHGKIEYDYFIPCSPKCKKALKRYKKLSRSLSS